MRSALGAVIVIGASACVTPALAATTWPSAQPTGVIYDTVASAQALRAALGEDGWVQQQPSASVLASTRQAWKVTTRAATASTPSILGRTGPEIADLLVNRITRAGGKLVFVDELDDAAVTSLGAPLAEALTLLAARTTPAGGTYAERVHIYLGPPRRLLADPAHPAWDALARAGGIWLEAYTSTREWDEPEWAVWPAMVAAGLRTRGVPDQRLRLLMTNAGNWAMSARACDWRAGGVGVYRAGEFIAGWISGWEHTFRQGLFACAPAPAATPEQLTDLAQLQALSAGMPVRPAQISGDLLWAGRRARVCVAGLSAVYGPGTLVQLRGAGASAQALVASDGGPACIALTPARPGNLSLRLRAPDGRLWQGGVMWGVDYGPLTPAVIARPSDPLLVSPLVGNRAVAGQLTARPVPAPARLRLSRRGAGWVRAQGRDPRTWMAVSVRVSGRAGGPVPGVQVMLRGPRGWGARLRTGSRGTSTAWVRQSRVGVLRGVVATRPALSARLRLR